MLCCVRKFLGLVRPFLRFGREGTKSKSASFSHSILKQAMNPIQQRLLALANTPADQLSTLGGFGGGPRSNPYNLHSAQHQEQLATAAAAPPPHHHHSVPRLDDGEPPQVRYSSFQILPSPVNIYMLTGALYRNAAAGTRPALKPSSRACLT